MIKHLYGLRKGQDVKLFVVGKEHCDGCHKQLDLIVVHFYARNIDPQEWVLCFFCAREMSIPQLRFARDPNIRTAMIAFELPHGAIPIISPTEMMYSRSTSLFEMITEGKTVDKTRHAGRPGYTLEGTEQVGKSISQLEHESDWKNDPEMLLDFHEHADAVLPEFAEKRLLK